MQTVPTSTQLDGRCDEAWLWNVVLYLKLYATGVPTLLYYWTTTPRYYLEVAVLTVVAYLTGHSFIVRHPHRLPHFIARPGSRHLHTYTLTSYDIERIFAEGVNLRSYEERKWRTPAAIQERFNRHGPLYQPTFRTITTFDFTPYQLIGPPLVQGRGLIGHHINVVLFEELGRCPDHRGVILGKVFRWKDRRTGLGRIPVGFVAVAGVQETAELEEFIVQWTWMGLEEGMSYGIPFDVSKRMASPTFASIPSVELDITDHPTTPIEALDDDDPTLIPITIPDDHSVSSFVLPV